MCQRPRYQYRCFRYKIIEKTLNFILPSVSVSTAWYCCWKSTSWLIDFWKVWKVARLWFCFHYAFSFHSLPNSICCHTNSLDAFLFQRNLYFFILWKVLKSKKLWEGFLCGRSLLIISISYCLNIEFADRPCYSWRCSRVWHFLVRGIPWSW